MINKQHIKVGVHDGNFHADDVVCVAMLGLKYGFDNLEVVRTRDTEVLATCDYVLDVGNQDIVTDNKVCFDHHNDKVETYENGVKMAACGKLARYLFADEPEVLKGMQENFLYSIEAPDNAQNLSELNLQPSKFTFVEVLNPSWTEESALRQERFMEAAQISAKMIECEIKKIKDAIQLEEILEDAYNKYGVAKNGVITLTQKFAWQDLKDAMVELNERHPEAPVIFVAFPVSDEKYNIYAIPDSKKEFNKSLFPDEWAGLEGEAMAEATGYASASFCHREKFMAVFLDLQEATHAAIKLVEEMRAHEKMQEKAKGIMSVDDIFNILEEERKARGESLDDVIKQSTIERVVELAGIMIENNNNDLAI